MKTVFIDYSGMYYSGGKKASLPDNRSGKFVQLRKDDVEYLVFSPSGLTAYHAEIVERFCRDRDIDGVYNTEKKRFDIHDQTWVVAGGGKFEIDGPGKRLRLYDNSMAYGRFDPRGLRERILQVEALKDYSVMIE
ncbi:MAG: hypothetical protein M0Z67_10355 [Nitrospiraceae bacterium]|nr:hypothetical protein [Nitrospiraceae bacterium]